MHLVYSRPSIIRHGSKQARIIDSKARYVVVEASTKSGKTTGCLIWLFEQALKAPQRFNCWWVAPVVAQAKIAFRRLISALGSATQLLTINRAEMVVTLPTGVGIYFKSAENPDSLYGEDVAAVVIDEAPRCKEEAWTAIRSTLTHTKGKCRIIGNVKGTNNWVYQIARRAESGEMPDWEYIKITADDAVQEGIFSSQELEDAKRTLSYPVFLELYYCVPNTSSFSKFAFSFEESKHVGSCSLNRNYPVYVSFDFNYNPICCVLIQYYNDTIYVPHVVKLDNSNIYTLCRKLQTMLDGYLLIVVGDASGNARSAISKDNLTYYQVIQRELKLSRSQMQQAPVNPPLEENQVLVNSVLEKKNVLIDPANASKLIYDLKFVEMLPDGTLKKTDRTKPEQQADALDAFRYWINRYKKLLGY